MVLSPKSTLRASENGECSDSWCTQYPFSVPVEKPMDVKDITRILRDHYEGTAYDLTKGIAAGPYGNPNRYGMLSNNNFSVL